MALALLAQLPPTRFARLGRAPALVVLLLTLLAIGLLTTFAVTYRGPIDAIVSTPGNGDLATYSQVVDDMRKGEPYYAAAHKELVAGHYGTRSVFNWRLPTLSWAWSKLPNAIWAKAALLTMAVIALMLVFTWFTSGVSPLMGLLAVPPVVFNLAGCLPTGAELLADVVAGVLILVSVAAYGLRARPIGFLTAVLALFIKELSAPYIVVCIIQAWRGRRYGELAAWLVALGAFSAFFLWHARMVEAHIAPGDIAYREGWLQFGGLPFVLATAGFNGVLLAAPLWITAIVAPLSILGLAAWDGPAGDRVRLTVGAYLVLFLFVGKAFDVYWGAFYTPLMMLGLPFVPRALTDLAIALRHRSPAPTVPASP